MIIEVKGHALSVNAEKLRTPDTGARATSQPWSNHLSQAGMMRIVSLLFVAVHHICLFVCWLVCLFV